MQRTPSLGLWLGSNGLLLAACSGQNPHANQKPVPVKHTIEMSRFSYSPNELKVKVGQEVTDEHAGFMVTIPENRDNAMISFNATQDMAGEWENGCFQQEGAYYDAGMKGKLVVVS